MKKIFLAAFVAFSAMMATSCGETENVENVDNPNTDTVLLKKVITTDADGVTDTVTFNYNGNKIVSQSATHGYSAQYFYTGNLITNVKEYDEGVLGNEMNYSYDLTNRLVLFENTDYFNNIFSKIEYTYVSNTQVTTVESLNNDGHGFAVTANGVMTLDANGNLIKYVRTFVDGGEEQVNNFTYDNKNNPFKNITGMQAIGLAEYDMAINNALTYAFPIFTAEPLIETGSSTFTYNANGYPETSTDTDEALGGTSVSRYIY